MCQDIGVTMYQSAIISGHQDIGIPKVSNYQDIGIPKLSNDQDIGIPKVSYYQGIVK